MTHPCHDKQPIMHASVACIQVALNAIKADLEAQKSL